MFSVFDPKTTSVDLDHTPGKLNPETHQLSEIKGDAPLDPNRHSGLPLIGRDL